MLTCQQSGTADRTAYFRDYQRKRRERRAVRHIHIELSAQEYELFTKLVDQQREGLEGAAKRLLMLGAKFAANAGTPRGKKYKTPLA